MGFLTKYGSFWGDIPETTGSVFFVSPTANYTIEGKAYAASNDNDGLSPERAVLTIANAILKATASVGDVIVLLPGTHTSSTQVAVNKAGLTFIGVHPSHRIAPKIRNHPPTTKVSWTSTFAGVAVALTVADCTFYGINFIPVTAQTFMTGTTCPGTLFSDVTVTLSAAASVNTKGVVFSGGSSQFVTFMNCYFINSVATSAQGPALDLTGCADFILDNVKVFLKGTSSAWAVTIQLGAGSSGQIINSHISAMGVGTITIGVDGTGVAVANAVLLTNNFYGVSPGAGAVKNLTNANVGIVNNYYGVIGGTAGGGVVQTITL